MSVDHYRTLEVTRTASAAEIQHAYRILAFQFHPDRNSSPESAARMTAINEAWEVLGDPERRREYDARLSRPPLSAELSRSILHAGRDMILRHDWNVLEDDGAALLLEKARFRLRVVFMERAEKTAVLRVVRASREFCVVLAVRVEPPVYAGPSAAVIDLLLSERHGAPLPEGIVRSLFAGFL